MKNNIFSSSQCQNVIGRRLRNFCISVDRQVGIRSGVSFSDFTWSTRSQWGRSEVSRYTFRTHVALTQIRRVHRARPFKGWKNFGDSVKGSCPVYYPSERCSSINETHGQDTWEGNSMENWGSRCRWFGRIRDVGRLKKVNGVTSSYFCGAKNDQSAGLPDSKQRSRMYRDIGKGQNVLAWVVWNVILCRLRPFGSRMFVAESSNSLSRS